MQYRHGCNLQRQNRLIMRHIKASKIIGIVFITVFLQNSFSFSQSTPANPPTPEAKPGTFKINEDRQFSSYRSVLIDHLASKRLHGVQDFCILGKLAADGTKSSWILWHQGKTIISWNGEDDPLKWASRKIDLTKDVVSSENDLHGSTFLVTKAWVKHITSQCDQDGIKIKITDKDLHQKRNHSIRKEHDHATRKE